MPFELPVIVPEWPAPKAVRALATTRLGGVSQSPWESLNLGGHVGDSLADVAANRRRLAASAGLNPGQLGWLEQVHSSVVVSQPSKGVPKADASVTRQRHQACTVLTADCLPVLFCDQAGTCVAAAHAGWRGLAGGILERTVAAMGVPAQDLMAWMGPAIGPKSFEVGPEVRAEFVAADPWAARAFNPVGARAGHFMADIWQLAKWRLESAGLTQVYGGGLCTASDPGRFYSFRRDGRTGRMASLVWLD
ncbi:MAG: peptidoglycan editing factor PgeF [Oleiphilaceae bacterium]|nr:peptidoglycan editing factor PgeF [Oleiphilaceae bacterium]